MSNVLIKKEAGIMRITLNRPEKKNALTRQMYQDMVSALDDADKDPSIKVVLFSGSSKCFTSGNDLNDFLNVPDSGEESPVVLFIHRVIDAKKPLVAAVAGPAVGIGSTILLHFDLVYAADNAKFIFPFVNLGVCPEAGSSILLQKLIGYNRAAEILLLGEPFGADKALEMGFVNAVYSEDDILKKPLEIAMKLAKQPPESVRTTKMLMKQGEKSKLKEMVKMELEHFDKMLQSGEAREAMHAFLEKRPPDFSQFE